MKIFFFLIIFTVLLPRPVFGNDVEYAVKIRNSNPEYGTRIFKELCENEKKSPCRLPVFLLYDVISNIESTKENLSPAAYLALKRHSKNAQVTWEFNLCNPRWDKNIPCVEVLGYLVVKDYKVTFYAFQKQKQHF